MQGRILAGRYRLERQLGKGGMGSVWSAEHLALHSTVAVKLLESQIARNPDAVERFQREAQAAATLRSAHVVQVLDYGVDDDTPFLVMEELQGQDLAARLNQVGRLTPEALLGIFQQVARAVGRAHEAGIIHRDLKPENIFLVQEGDQEIVKVLDFGIAKSVKPGFAPSATRTGVTMGTPYYMSPEQAEGKRQVDHRTDLWALGVIASECLTGVRPFDGETFGELLLNICARPAPVPSTLAEVPRHFDAWFAKATHRDPEARFDNVAELVLTFGQVVAGRVPDGVDTRPLHTTPLDEQGHALLPTQAALPGALPAAVPAAMPAAMPSGFQNPPQHAAPSPTTQPDVSVTMDPVDTVPMSSGGKWVLPVLALAMLGVVGVGGWWWTSSASKGTGPSGSSSVVEPVDLPPRGGDAPATPPTVDQVDEPPEAMTPPNAVKRLANPDKRPPSKPGSKPPSKPPNQGKPQASVAAKPEPPPEPPRVAPPPTTKPPASTALRCVSDPFTGALRPGGGAGTVPCKRNSFTGQYQRL